MKAEAILMLKSRLTYSGVTSAARQFGCSREHLSRVLHGQRKPSESLARKLKRMGVDLEVA